MTNFDFNMATDVGFEEFELLPKGTLAWAKVKIEDKKTSGSGNEMLHLTYRLLGKYEGTEIRYEYLIYSGTNSKGVPNLSRALGRVEAMFLCSKKNTADFKDWKQVDGLIVGVKLGHKKEQDGGEAKYNNIMSELSPKPESRSHKDYLDLVKQQGEAPLDLLNEQTSASVSIDEEEIPFG